MPLSICASRRTAVNFIDCKISTSRAAPPFYRTTWRSKCISSPRHCFPRVSRSCVWRVRSTIIRHPRRRQRWRLKIFGRSAAARGWSWMGKLPQRSRSGLRDKPLSISLRLRTLPFSSPTGRSSAISAAVWRSRARSLTCGVISISRAQARSSQENFARTPPGRRFDILPQWPWAAFLWRSGWGRKILPVSSMAARKRAATALRCKTSLRRRNSKCAQRASKVGRWEMSRCVPNWKRASRSSTGTSMAVWVALRGRAKSLLRKSDRPTILRSRLKIWPWKESRKMLARVKLRACWRARSICRARSEGRDSVSTTWTRRRRCVFCPRLWGR